MTELKRILMTRDQITSDEADVLISIAKQDLRDRLESGDMPYDILEEHFGLEPDYIFDLM